MSTGQRIRQAVMKAIKLSRAATAILAGAVALAGCGLQTGSGASAPRHHGQAPASSSSASASSHSPAPGNSTSAPPAGGAPSSFQVLSMTFVSDQRGWALGTVACGSGRCAALLGTTNGGATWHRLAAPAKRAGGVYNTCSSRQPCISQVRFATPLIGYAFGPSLFQTTDGGRHWRQVPRPSIGSLEIADGNVVAVTSSGQGCSGMPYQVRQAPVGSTAWQTLAAPPIIMICPPLLYRQGDRLVLVAYGNAAGGVRASAGMAGSGDDGATWTRLTDQCGGKDGYAAAVTIAPPDVLVLLCRHQMPSASGDFGAPWVRVSQDGGTGFGPDRPVAAAGGLPTKHVDGYQIAAASASRLLVVATSQHGDRAYLSENGGRTWSSTLRTPGSDAIILVGFEDPLTARIAEGDQVWTTRDGGQHWTANTFPN